MIMGGRVAVFMYVYIYRYAYILYNPIMCETVCNISETIRDIQRRHDCKNLASRSWLSWLSQVSLPFRLLCFAWTRNQSEDRELSNAGEVACGCASSIRDLMYSLSSKCIKRNLKAWNLLWSTWASSRLSAENSEYRWGWHQNRAQFHSDGSLYKDIEASIASLRWSNSPSFSHMWFE